MVSFHFCFASLDACCFGCNGDIAVDPFLFNFCPFPFGLFLLVAGARSFCSESVPYFSMDVCATLTAHDNI